MSTAEELRLTADTLAEVESLYQAGRYLSAFEAARPLGPFHDWPGTHGRLLAGRLATNLGSPRLGQALVRLAWRQDQEDLFAGYYHALIMFRTWGPLRTWRALRRLGDYSAASPSLQADWHGLWAHVLAMLRDQQRAQRHLEEALQLAPERAWTWVQRSAILSLEDRPEEALRATRKAMELRPFYRPAVQSLAATLLDLGRDQEALQLLTDAAARLECGDVVSFLATVQTELRMYAGARENYDRLADYYPLMDREKHFRDWLSARRSDAAYFCGDHAAAAALARDVKEGEVYKAFADRLETLAQGQRVLLNVGFVRQNRETCAPATLAAISNYWQHPADHEEIARQICYDGTPGHHERQWASDQGFVTREFRVTWESVTALLNRGLPLTLTTVSPGNAHLQAIIGYDDYRRTLIVRDPSVRTFAEYDADELLKQYQSTGPRGMVMAPSAQEHLLSGIELPDAEMFDGVHQISRFLTVHDRPAAQAKVDQMRARDANHPLTHRAQWSLAGYDNDARGGLACAEALLVAFPDDVNLLMSKLAYFRELGRREERTALLESLRGKKDCHPLFLGELAADLSNDARAAAGAEQLLKRVVRYRPMEGRWYGLWGDLFWSRQQREEALEMYRFAACLDDKVEGASTSYFVASRNLRRDAESLHFLRERYTRLGKLSSRPGRTLAWAYDQLNRHEELFATLEAALALRPEDAELLLFAAEYNARYGQQQQADLLMAQAEGQCHPGQWLRQAARMATYRGQAREALAHWQQALAQQPLDGEAQAEVARLLADLEGRPAAIAHLRREIERFPHHYGLRQLLIEWLREEPPEVQEAEVRALLARHEDDAWAQRELAIVLQAQGRWEEAALVAECARHLEPASPVVHWIIGRNHQAAGQTAAARGALREAIRHSVDYQPAIESLMALCDAKSEREEELTFVRAELERQVIFGDGLLAFREHAEHTWGPQATLQLLQQALAARGDLWHAHAAVIRQLTALDRWEEAHSAAREAVSRFPLLPRLWLELSATCSGLGDAEGEAAALEKALEINPAWGEASCRLAELEQRRGNLVRARELLDRALVHEPQNARIHATLADLLWELSQPEAAIDAMKRAVELVPENEWVWKRLREWLAPRDRFEELLALARAATEVRPYSAALWIILSEMYGSADRNEEAVAALQSALAVDPRHVDANSLRAYYLSQAGRWNEALAACRPEVFGDDRPLALRSREAHLMWQLGDRDEALARMRAVVAEDPEYYWAWTRLADWYDELNDTGNYLEAAKHLTRIAPKYGQSHGYEGHARLRSGDRAGAKASLKQAVTLLPDYRFASELLFDMQCEDGEAAEAEATVTAATPHLDPVTLLAWRACLAAARNDRPAALALLKELGTTQLPDAVALDKAVGGMARAGWTEQAITQLQAVLEMSECDPHVAVVWTNVCVLHTGQSRRWQKQMKRLRDRGEIWHRAARFYLDRSSPVPGGAPQPLIESTRVPAFVRSNRRWLTENVASWSAAGEALLRVGRIRSAVAWMKDWRQRGDARPEHLLPVAEALWSQDRADAAREVSRYALTLQRDSYMSGHLLLLALGQVRDGQNDAAREQLAQLDWRLMSGKYQALYNLLWEGLLKEAAAPQDWPTAHARLEQAVKTARSVPVDPWLLRAAIVTCRLRLAKDRRRTLRAAWWAFEGFVLRW